MARLKKQTKKDFTLIDNAMIRDKNLGGMERGLLLTLLSLPDGWQFSIKGLSKILPDGTTKISSALKKLEIHGYLVRERKYENGKIIDWDYIFSDNPKDISSIIESKNEQDSNSQETENLEDENLELENLNQGNQELENRCNNKINNNQELLNQESNDKESINQSYEKDGQMDSYLRERNIYTEIVKTNIDYDNRIDYVGEQYVIKTNDELDELVDIIVNAICSKNESEIICGQTFPHEIIKSALLKVDYKCLEDAVKQMSQNSNIKNYRKYLISTLINEANSKNFKRNSDDRNDVYLIARDFQ